MSHRLRPPVNGQNVSGSPACVSHWLVQFSININGSISTNDMNAEQFINIVLLSTPKRLFVPKTSDGVQLCTIILIIIWHEKNINEATSWRTTERGRSSHLYSLPKNQRNVGRSTNIKHLHKKKTNCTDLNNISTVLPMGGEQTTCWPLARKKKKSNKSKRKIKKSKEKKRELRSRLDRWICGGAAEQKLRRHGSERYRGAVALITLLHPPLET